MKIYKIKNNVIFLAFGLLVEVGLTSYLATWKNSFWQSVENKNFKSFLILIGIFTVVALLLCIVSGLQSYISNKLALEYRRRLTCKALKITANIENLGQRIQDDCMTYPLLYIQLARQYIYTIIMTVFYIYLVVHEVGWLFILFPFIYCLIATAIGGYIAHPLIALNYYNQVTEATFRQLLSKVSYAKAHSNNHKMFKKTKHLNYWQSFVAQLGAIFPYVVLSVLYFSSQITLGVLMMIASSLIHLVDIWSVFVSNFATINKFLSCKRRLKEANIL